VTTSNVTSGYLDFKEAPSKGHIHVASDQIYVCEGAPTDAGNRAPLQWRTHCAECGAEFRLNSGLVGKTLTRRCAQHRNGRRASNDTAHPASQGKAETKPKQRTLARPTAAAPAAAATAHPLYAKWCEYVNAHPEAKRGTLLSFKTWLVQRENALD